MRTNFTVLIFLFFSFVLSAQNVVPVSGEVVVDEKKFGGVLVTVENHNLGTITDASGKFELMVPEGRQTLMFRVNGILRHHHSADFSKENKYSWDVKVGPKYSKAHLIRMKKEGREDELELSTIEVKAYTMVQGTVGFDDMFLPNSTVTVKETGDQATTDSEGKFELWVIEGLQTLEFSFHGFEPFTYKLQVDSKKKYDVEAKFGPAYSKEFLEQKKAEGKLSELKRSECTIKVSE